nr:MAG TPA: hypothetical protein [Bacteriophage sp.]
MPCWRARSGSNEFTPFFTQVKRVYTKVYTNHQKRYNKL